MYVYFKGYIFYWVFDSYMSSMETKFNLILSFFKVLILLETDNKMENELLFVYILGITQMIGNEKQIYL